MHGDGLFDAEARFWPDAVAHLARAVELVRRNTAGDQGADTVAAIER